MRKMIIALALVWMTGVLYGQKILTFLQLQKSNAIPEIEMREEIKYEEGEEEVNTIFFFRPGIIIMPLTIYLEKYSTINSHKGDYSVKGCRKKVSAKANSCYKRMSVIEVF